MRLHGQSDHLPVPPVTSISDGIRTISWILIFVTILFTFVREVRPTLAPLHFTSFPSFPLHKLYFLSSPRSLTHSVSLSLTLSHSHTHSLTLTLSLSLSLTLTHTWDDTTQAPVPLGLRHFSGVYMVYRSVWFIYNVTNDDANDLRLMFEGISYTAALIFCALMVLPLKFPSLEPEEGRMHISGKKKAKLRWPGPSDIWGLLGTPVRRFLAVLCFVVAFAEGVVRSLTFSELGIVLVSCFPTFATCYDDNIVIFHELPNRVANVQRLIPFFTLAISVGFLRAGVRTLSTYVMQMTINHLKDTLFGRALSCTRIYIRTAKADINQTIHYYLDREFLKT